MMEAWIFEHTSDPALVVQSEGTIVRANKAVETVLGHVPSSLEGKSLGELVGPEEREAVLALVARCASGDESQRLLTRVLTRDGSRHVELHGARQGGVLVLLMCPRIEGNDEIEHLRTIVRRWNALIHCLPDHVTATTPEGTILFVNRVPPGLTLDSVIGQPMRKFVVPDEHAALDKALARVYAGEQVLQDIHVILPNGERATFQSRRSPVYEGTQVVGMVSVTRDLTAQHRAEESQRQAEKQMQEYMAQLERSNSELERFASIASHDLQEPLRKIQAFSDRLQQKFGTLLSEAGTDYLVRMQDAARRMQELINDLLMFSRLSTKDRRFVPVNLNKSVATVLSDLEIRMEESAAKVEIGQLPTIDADPLHMRQLFQNLIGNALKFRRPDVAPQIRVSAAPLPGTAKVRITVSDNGIGIDPKYHERVFGIFERLHSRGKYEGTGIGLAVCRKICEQLGGMIRVESVPERGSTFIIELPIRQETP